MIRRPKALAWYVLSIGWLVAACGGNAATPIPGTTVEMPETPLSFTIIGENLAGGAFRSAFALEGEDLASPGPTITVRAGQSVAITFKNTGESLPADHNFVIVAEKSADAEPLWGAATDQLGPGEQQTISFTPDTPGRYFYICSVDTHLTNGMWGEFVVEE